MYKKNMIYIGLLFFSIAVFIFSGFGKTEGKVYDCREAHWHPDYPIEVRRQCIELIKEYYEKQLEEKKIIRT